MTYELRTTDQEVLICEGAKVTKEHVRLGRGVSVWYNAVLRGDEGAITIGEDTNIQDGAVLHAETTVGRGCTVGHNAILHGCVIGDNVLIGMGAVVLDGARIGDNCLVGAGALVTGKTDAPAGSLLLGNPAKVVRALTEAEIQGNRESAREYLEFAAQARAGR